MYTLYLENTYEIWPYKGGGLWWEEPYKKVPLDGGNLLVFNNLNASEIWPYKGGGLWWEEPYKRGITI